MSGFSRAGFALTDVAARAVEPIPPAEGPEASVVGAPAAEAARIAESWAKRALDILGAFIALLVFLPLLITIGMLVRLESGGPMIFKQRRTGHGGRVFTIYKFRTMTVAEDGHAVRQATRDDSRVERDEISRSDGVLGGSAGQRRDADDVLRGGRRDAA